MQTRYQKIPASDKNAGYDLAIKILERIKEDFGAEDANTVAQHLRAILYKNNLKLVTLHADKLRQFIETRYENTVNDKAQYYQICLLHIDALKQDRIKQLYHWFSYIRFWSAKQWPHLNLLFLVVPLVVGIFVPVVGLGALIFLAIYTTVSILDLGVQSESYWEWQDIPNPTKNPLIQEETLQNNSSTIDLLARPKDSLVNRRLNDILYYGDIIAVVICLLSVISFIFPPVGIPVLALTILTGLALLIGGAQWLAIIKQQAQEQEEVNNLTSSTILDSSKKWFNSNQVQPDCSEQQVFNPGHTIKTDNTNWLLNPLSWYKPPSVKPTPSRVKLDPLKWIINMMKWQNAEAPQEIKTIFLRQSSKTSANEANSQTDIEDHIKNNR